MEVHRPSKKCEKFRQCGMFCLFALFCFFHFIFYTINIRYFPDNYDIVHMTTSKLQHQTNNANSNL
jgi:hypothetical protein